MIGVEYTTTAKGEVAKFVTCKKCGCEYGYWMKRSVSSSNTSWFLIGRDSARNRSTREAEGELAERLRTEHDPVPCPKCGHYQKNMWPAAREEKYSWMLFVGIMAGLVLAAMIMACGEIVSRLGGDNRLMKQLSRTIGGMACPALIVVPILAHLLKKKLMARYDPNSTPQDDRIDLGRERAMGPKEHARHLPKPPRSANPAPPPDDDPLPMADGPDD
jgi:hypothetical protein